MAADYTFGDLFLLPPNLLSRDHLFLRPDVWHKILKDDEKLRPVYKKTAKIKFHLCNQYERTVILYPMPYLKENSFHLIEESTCTFYELKIPKCKQTLNICKTVFY